MTAVTVYSAPDDGRKGRPKHVEHTARVASCWFIIYYSNVRILDSTITILSKVQSTALLLIKVPVFTVCKNNLLLGPVQIHFDLLHNFLFLQGPF